MEPDSIEHQTNALLWPAVYKDNGGSRLAESGHYDFTPQQIDTSMYDILRASMPESPLLVRAIRRLHKQPDYFTSSKSNLQMTISKSSSQLVVDPTTCQAGDFGAKVTVVEAMSRGNCLVSSTGASLIKAQLPLVNLNNATITGLSTSFPLASCDYLPFKSQNQLLARLQHVLELACYSFGELIMPEILLSHGWDCAERVELNRWTRILKQREEFSNFRVTGKSAEEFFRSIADIRHCAVHRRQVSAESLKEFFVDAEALVTLFGGEDSRSHITMLR